MSIPFPSFQSRRPQRTAAAWALAIGLLSSPWLAQAQGVSVQGAWARPTVQGQPAGGGFLTLQSDRADRLVGASSPAAERVELHSMAMEGDVMRMRQVETIDLPAQRKVALAPGGLHLMLLGLKQPLKAGETVPLVLRFEKAGEVSVQMKVSPTAP